MMKTGSNLRLQMGRRNITPDQREELCGRRYVLERKANGERGDGKKPDQNEQAFGTAERIGDEWSK